MIGVIGYFVKHRVILVLLAIGGVLLCSGIPKAFAESKTWQGPAVWRADGAGDYTFVDGAFTNTGINSSGYVEASAVGGTYESGAVTAAGTISSITATWTVGAGAVSLKVSADGGTTYSAELTGGTAVTTGFGTGSSLKYKATFGASGNTLTDVSIKYIDASGVTYVFDESGAEFIGTTVGNDGDLIIAQ